MAQFEYEIVFLPHNSQMWVQKLKLTKSYNFDEMIKQIERKSIMSTELKVLKENVLSAIEKNPESKNVLLDLFPSLKPKLYYFSDDENIQAGVMKSLKCIFDHIPSGNYMCIPGTTTEEKAQAILKLIGNTWGFQYGIKP